MTAHSNTSTRKLEGFARARGLDYGIMVDHENADGVFFCVNIDGDPLIHWRSLGWTRAEAEVALIRLSESRKK